MLDIVLGTLDTLSLSVFSKLWSGGGVGGNVKCEFIGSPKADTEMKFIIQDFIPKMALGETSMESGKQARDRELSQAREQLRPNPSICPTEQH